MTRITIHFVGVVAALLLVSMSDLKAQDAPLTAAQESRVQELIRGYLLEHPEVINEAAQVLRERQAAQEAAHVAQAVQEHRDELLNNPTSPVAGNPDGAITVVEFLDYNCPYCRRAEPVLAELAKANPDVRLVYKDFPNLAESSSFAAKAALAVRRQHPDLYTAFRHALMAAQGQLTEDAVVAAARGVGVDVERMRADMADPAIEESIKRNIKLAHAIGVTGTPTFVVGNTLLRGFKTLAQLESALGSARLPAQGAGQPATATATGGG